MPATSHVTSSLPAPPAFPDAPLAQSHATALLPAMATQRQTTPSSAREIVFSASEGKKKRGRPVNDGPTGDNSDQNELAKKSQKSVPEGSGDVLNNAYFLSFNVAPEMIFCHADEGRFQMLWSSGAFMPTPNRKTMSGMGGTNVTFSSTDGRFIKVGFAGETTPDSPVTIVVASFSKTNDNPDIGGVHG